MPPQLVLLVFSVLSVALNVKCEIVIGQISSDKEEAFISKFNFMSVNSSLEFEFAYPEEYTPLRLRAYWDSPIAWVDTFHMRVTCPKKQAILHRLSAGQVIHLDPSMSHWCQRIPLSTEIIKEFKNFPFELQWNDWISVFSAIIAKISGAIRDAKDWLDPISSLITPDTLVSTSPRNLPENTTASQLIQSDSPKGLDLPEVVQLAWNSYMKKQKSKELPEMTNWIYCKSPTIDLRFSQAVWWFFVLERCTEEQSTTPSPVLFQPPILSGVEVTYQMTFLNGLPGDIFRAHFSSEKFGNLEMDIVFFLFISTMFFFAVIITYKLHRSHQLHPTVFVWLFSIALRCVAHLLRLILEFHFALTGLNSVVFASLIQLLYSTSTSALFAGLLLLSSGYTIVHRVLSRPIAITLCVFLGAYTLVNAATQIAMVLLETRGDVLSHYHSKASYVFVSLQLGAWIGFCISCGYTLFTWSQKRLFFIRLVAVFSLWFWNIPMWTFVTIGVTHKRFTENLIRVWDELITLGAYILLLLILRPENANTVFPFHLSHAEGTSRETIVPPEKPTKTEKKLPNLLAPIKSVESPVLPRSRPRTPETPRVKSTGKAASPGKPLPEIGGKPGDTPGPGFTLSHNLAEIAATDSRWSNRPRTTPSMNAPRVKLELKHSSAN